jgi:hypothetical protein
MKTKSSEKQKAIKLRKEGKTYSEILTIIPVAKSTLSLWLRDVGIAKQQKQRLTTVKIAAAKRGGEARHKYRIEQSTTIIKDAKQEIKKLTHRELFLIGTVLYWCEGSKEKPHRPGSGIDFINMDPKMILLFLQWLLNTCKIPKDMIGFETYLHQTHAHRVEDIKIYWAKITGFPLSAFDKIRFKKHKLSPTKRKNIGESYHGSLRIKVRSSSTLVRKIAGWVEGIAENSIKK